MADGAPDTVAANVAEHPLIARLDDVLAALGSHGLVADAGQRVRLITLLVQLAAEGRLPEDAERLARLMTPVLAGTPAQQVLCETTIRTVLGGDGPAPMPQGGEAKLSEPEPETTIKAQTWLSRFAIGFIAGLMLIAGVTLAVLYGPQLFAPDVMVEPKPNVVAGNPVQVSFDWLKDYPIEELEPPRQSPWNRTWRWYYTEYTPAKWAGLLLPWLLYAGLLYWAYLRMLAYLRREAMKQNLRSLDWRLDGASARFADRQLIGDLQPLRLLARAWVRRLDPDRTALASAEAGGLLSPRFRDVAVPTDFVALVDRQGPRDHLAEFNMQVVSALRDAGLTIEVLEFDQNPAHCRFVRSGEFTRLDALIRRFPDSVMLLFSTAEQLVDPARNRLLPAALALRETRRSFLLTPRLDTVPSALEREVARRLGMTVIGTTPGSIGHLKRLLLEEGRPAAKATRPAAPSQPELELHDFLAERPGRWMQSVPPQKADLERLGALLRAAFRPRAMAWLSAATIYPELRWPLTLSLKAALADGGAGRRPALDGELLAVARLPWFRHGWMPDWVRSLMQDVLSDGDRRKGRQAILEAMGLAGRSRSRPGETLDIRFDAPKATTANRLKVDSIMIDYLWPLLRSLKRQFALPSSWLRQIARKPIRRFAGVATVGMLSAGALSFSALSLIPIDECDLLAASVGDNFRVGPGNLKELLSLFYAKRAITACKAATEREPNNGRFWYQYSRALYVKDPHEAHPATLKSVKLNYPAGHNALGLEYSDGIALAHDVEREIASYKTAAALGNYESLRNLGIVATEQNKKEQAFEYYKSYVDLGGQTTYELANYYLEGSVVPQDPKKYIELLRLGVSRGDSTSISVLGVEYSRGDYLPMDLTYGASLQEQSLKENPDSTIARNVGTYYRHGNGVKTDYAKATYWFIFAAKLGNADALQFLFEMIQDGTAKFKDGYGPPAGYEARQLLHPVAAAGNALIQLRLAKLIEEAASKGTATMEEAIVWYRKAAAQGDSDAKEALKRLGVGEAE